MAHSRFPVFPYQPPHNGETAALTPAFSPHPQHPHPYQNAYYTMHPQQHIPAQLQQHQQHQQQQQQQQQTASRMPLGYTGLSDPFAIAPDYLVDDFLDYGASLYNAANYNVGGYQQQPEMIASRMTSGYAQQSEFDMVPAYNNLAPSHASDTSAYNASTYNAPTLNQQQAAMMPSMYPVQPSGYAPFTPPGQQQTPQMTPRASSGYPMGAMGQQLRTPPTASPSHRRGFKRAADDSQMAPTPKRQATGGYNVATGGHNVATGSHNVVRQPFVSQMAQLAAEAKRAAQKAAREKREADLAEKRRQAELAEAKKKAEEEKLRALAEAKARKAEALKAEAKRQADARRQEAQFQAEQALFRAEHERAQRRTQQAAIEAAAQKARDDEAAEELRIAREERDRRSARAKELRSDPGALYHSYHELLEHFPLKEGEEKDTYLLSLLANRRLLNYKPGDEAYEVIMFAKEHYYEFPEHKHYKQILARVNKKKEEELAAQEAEKIAAEQRAAVNERLDALFPRVAVKDDDLPLGLRRVIEGLGASE